MKKALIFILLFAFSLSFLALTPAKKAYDSINISEDERFLLDLDETDKVVKVFSLGNIYKAFAEKKQLSEMLQSDTFYFVLQDSNYAYGHYIKENGVTVYDPGLYAEYLYNFLTLALQPEKVFDSSVKVKETYCFESSYYSSFSLKDYFIYYKTNKGDFVVFSESVDDEKSQNVYVIPVEDFCSFSKLLLAYIQESSLIAGGTGLVAVADLRPYKVATKEIKPVKWWIPVSIVGGAVLGAGLGSLITLVVLKKKKSQQESA